MERPVILCSEVDAHVLHLADRISKEGIAPQIIDSARVREHVWQAGLKSFPISGTPRGVIFGLPVPSLPTLGEAENSAWVEFAEGLAYDVRIDWLTPLHHLRRADNKLYQLSIAEKAGVPFPPTIIASSKTAIQQHLGDAVVVKPLGSGLVPQANGTRKVFYASLVQISTLRDETLSIAPFIAQELIETEKHLRVVTLFDYVWCAFLNADSCVDWREMSPDSRRNWSLFTPPNELRDSALRITKLAGIAFSSQDWLLSSDGFWFLDLNPVGRWLFLPREIVNSVTDLLVQWLLGKNV